MLLLRSFHRAVRELERLVGGGDVAGDDAGGAQRIERHSQSLRATNRRRAGKPCGGHRCSHLQVKVKIMMADGRRQVVPPRNVAKCRLVCLRHGKHSQGYACDHTFMSAAFYGAQADATELCTFLSTAV
jgi:hypothetical protein